MALGKLFAGSVWGVEMLIWEVAGYWKHKGKEFSGLFPQGCEEVRLLGLRSLSERIFRTDLLAGQLSWRGRKAQGQWHRGDWASAGRCSFHVPRGSRPGTDQRPKGLSKDIRIWQQRQIRIKVKAGAQGWIMLAASQLASNLPLFLPPINPFSSTREGFLRVHIPCWLPPCSWLQPPFWLTPSNLSLGLLLF